MSDHPRHGERWWCELPTIGRRPVPKLSAVNLDSVESVSLGVLVERLGRLGDERMREVCGATSVAVSCR